MAEKTNFKELPELTEKFKKVAGIYLITILPKGIQYVGSTDNLFHRKEQHLSALRHKYHKNEKMQNHYNKYGEENVIFSVLETVDDLNEILDREDYWIGKLDTFYNGLNLVRTPSRPEMSEKTKQKLREGKLGEKNPMYGIFGKDHPSAKPVVFLETLEYFDCARDITRKYNLSYKGVSNVCTKKRKTYKGYHFYFYPEFTQKFPHLTPQIYKEVI